MDALLSLIFERFPILNLSNGLKRKIGDALLILTAVLVALQGISGELQELHLPDEAMVQLLAILGAATKLVGQLHAISKERRGVS